VNWPYRSIFRAILTQSASIVRPLDTFEPVDCPWLHIYGNSMPQFMRFHDDSFIKRVEKSCPGVSNIQSTPGNHWFMNSTDTFQSYIKKLDLFLDATEDRVMRRPSQALTPVLPSASKM